MKEGDPAPASVVRRLAGSVSLYLAARAASGALRLLTVPLIVHVVSAEAFGTLATLYVPLLALHGAADLGLGGAAIRHAPECATPSEQRDVFATLLLGRTVASLLVMAIVVSVHEPLAAWVTGSPGNGRALLWLAVTRPFASVFEALLDVLRARQAIGKVSGLVFWSVVAVQGLSVALVLGAGLELEGLVWGRAAGDALACAAAAVLCWGLVRGRPRLARLGPMLAFGWPLGTLYLLSALQGLDRPLLRALTSVEHVAGYELAMRLVAPVGLFNIALALVLQPFVYGHSTSRETPQYVDLFVRAYVTFFAAVAMALATFGPEAIALIAPEPYHGAIHVLPALAFSATCEGLQRASGVGADLAKRTGIWAAGSLLTLLCGFGLMFLLVPRVGIAGAALAWLAANGLTTALVYPVARLSSSIVLPVGRGLAVVFVGGLIGTVAAHGPWPLPARLGLLGAFTVAGWHVMQLRWADLRALVREPAPS